MKQIKQETGRSMVEMLGVLAVIGVLSVGGISGYTLAMNKHRANSVAADLMKRAVVISAQRQLGQDPNVQGLGSQVGEYDLGSIEKDDDKQTFAMTVQDVPQEVCKKILALDWDNAAITPATAEGCDGGDMTFTYNNDLSSVTDSGSTGGEGTDTPPEPTCEGTVCGANCCLTGTTCNEGKCCADYVLDENGENIGCAPEGYELYCGATDGNGDCTTWEICPEGQENTKDWIVGMPEAFGRCFDKDATIYCGVAGPSGCSNYFGCLDNEDCPGCQVGKNLEAYAKQTGHDVGGEVCCPDGKVYCQVAFLDGTCEYYDCQANYEGELTQGIYGDLDVICPSAATPYIIKEEGPAGNGYRFVGGCCYGTVQPGDAYQGIGDTCID